ncbi:PepSY domain-containing protein [Bradyrhizobium genosp. A]|uniref:PepSY domain-containing protein n=1 Tax=Bradyrhizobium genosp. A TaxID=83626 RepID=UPI003CF5AE2A
MTNKRLFAIMLCSATLAAADVAAATPPPLDAASLGAADQRDAEDAALRRMLEQFRAIQISLTEAMATAERLHDGSRTADISFEISGPPAYRARTVKNERIWENVIDANTGRVLQKETTSSLKELDRGDLANIIALKWIKQRLSDAVRVAEKAAAGSALAGGLMKQDGKLNFVVVIANGDRLKEVMLEPPKLATEGAIHQ